MKSRELVLEKSQGPPFIGQGGALRYTVVRKEEEEEEEGREGDLWKEFSWVGHFLLRERPPQPDRL